MQPDETAIRFPVYYNTTGIPNDHWVHRGGAGLAAGIGPADATDAERGGYLFGAQAWVPALAPLLKKTRASWWVALGDAAPHHLARIAPIPGPIVPGARDGHSWMVPRLLRWQPGHGFVAAIPLEFRDYTWQVPVHLEGIIERLRHFLLGALRISNQIATVDDIVPDAETTRIAIDLLKINYHISEHELSVGGWLTDALAGAILLAASGAEIPHQPASSGSVSETARNEPGWMFHG